MADASLSVVIVAHDSLGDLRHTLPALAAQLQPGDELIIVDNASADGLEAGLEQIAPKARLVSMGANAGFAAGANAGGRAARGDLLVLLNPDALVDPGWADAIRAPFGSGWAAWMGLVLLDGGRLINTSGSRLHFTGVAWAGQMGMSRAAAPVSPTDVAALSGACLAVPLETWRRLEGFPEQFFMYCEDVDLSLRLRLGGGRLAVIPAASVRHRYEFDKGAYKWRLLERNRWATVIRTFPAPLLAAVAPALIAMEAAMWLTAARGGWARMKLLATADVCRALPRLLRERRQIQGRSVIDSRRFAQPMTAAFDSPYLGSPAVRRLAGAVFEFYWRAALSLLP